MAASATTTTMVRMKVAKSGLMFCTPTLARIAVSAANTAERSAQSCHVMREPFMLSRFPKGDGTFDKHVNGLFRGQSFFATVFHTFGNQGALNMLSIQ